MRILFLDDVENRHKAFKLQAIGCDITHVYSADQACAVLNIQPPFDLASLDHDLVELTSKVERTGYEVAVHIAKMPADRRPKRIVIHSHNDLGRQRMAEVLTKVGCQVTIEPFQG